MRRDWFVVGVASVALAACGGDDGGSSGDDAGADDASVDADQMFVPPTTLAETGLCADAACTTFNPGILEYAPQYQLYSDGATKRRWIQLPPGTQIDTTDMDHWRFPVGTKVWKEFTSNGTRVETRLIQKVGADDTLIASYFMGSFVWNQAQDATTLADPTNGAPDANGTTHNVPTRSECRQCHQGVPGRVLGVDAMSLDYDSTSLDLADLVSMNLLTTPPVQAGAPSTPYFPITATQVEKDAFGYLHANCGSCHNPTSTIYTSLGTEMSFGLEVGATKRDVATNVPAFASTTGKSGTVGDANMGLKGLIIDPATPANSVVLIRMNYATSGIRMPALGIEIKDQPGIDAVAAWIEALP